MNNYDDHGAAEQAAEARIQGLDERLGKLLEDNDRLSRQFTDACWDLSLAQQRIYKAQARNLELEALLDKNAAHNYRMNNRIERAKTILKPLIGWERGVDLLEQLNAVMAALEGK